MERELALEIVRATEAAALASAQWIGRGKKNEADDAATTAMREVLNTVNMNGTVVIGEGELDEAPMLFIGERVGTASVLRRDETSTSTNRKGTDSEFFIRDLTVETDDDVVCRFGCDDV